MSGFDVDMLRQVAAAIFGPNDPNDIHFTIVPNADRVQDVQKGLVDILAETMTITCKTGEVRRLLDRLLRGRPGDPGPEQLDHQRESKTSAGSGSVRRTTRPRSESACPDLPHMQLWGVNNMTDCLVMLQQGQVDAISTDDAILHRPGRPGSERQGPRHRPSAHEPYGMAISKAHPGFTSFVNGVLAQVRADGTWAQIYDNNLEPLHADAGTRPSPGDLPVSAMTKITVEGIDERIGQFRAVLDRTTANLVALDADMTRQLLESSTSLRGATAASWADASGRHADLWRGQLALENALTQIAQLRGTRKSPPQAVLVRLDEHLGAACVQLPRAPDGARPRLTEGPMPTLDLTIADALDAMSKDYDVVAQVVAAVAEVWGEPSERLRRAGGGSGEARGAARSARRSAVERVPVDCSCASRRPKRWPGTTRWRWMSLPCPGWRPG